MAAACRRRSPASTRQRRSWVGRGLRRSPRFPRPPLPPRSHTPTPTRSLSHAQENYTLQSPMAAAGRRRSPAHTSQRRRWGGLGLRRSPRIPRPPSPPRSLALEPPAPLRPGDDVEVRVDAEGYFGTWYEATVVGIDPAHGRRSATRYSVACSHVVASNGGALAVRLAPTHIRPRAPPPSSGPSPPRFLLHDIVEARDRGGWWSGIVVAGADPAGGGSVTVAFPITREVISFAPHSVRPRRDYVGGEWVPSRAVIDEQAHPRRVLKVYEVGDKVEVSKNQEVYGYSWFAATVAKVVDRFSYIVEYSEQEEGEKATEYLYWQWIRPAVDRSPQESEFQLVPGAAVEAYCDGAWSLGVVHRVVGEDEYEVSVNKGKANRMVTKVVELLKLHYRWDGNRWTIVKPKRKANLRHQHASRKRPSSPEYSGTKKSKKVVVLAGGSEHVPVSEKDNLLSASHKSPANNYCANSCSLLPENGGRETHPIQALQGEKDASDDVHIQLKENSNSGRKEINSDLSTSLECHTSSAQIRQVSGGTNSGSKMNVYTRKLNMKKSLKGPETSQSSVNVTSAIHNRERKKAAECMKQSSSILEGTGFQIQPQLDRTLEDTLNLNEGTNQKLPPVVAGLEEWYNRKGFYTPSNLLHKGLTTTKNSTCQVIRNEDVLADNTDHIMETPTLYPAQLVRQDGDNVNEKSILLGLQNAGSSQCITENSTVMSSSISGSSMPSHLAVSQISGHEVVFVKSSPVWSLIESMDVFKKAPQQPHFHPLKRFPSALREGMALGLMSTFDSSVKKIRKLSLADSMASFEEMISALHHLMENGFSVQYLQNYLLRLFHIKTDNTKHLEEKGTLKAQMLEKTTSLSGIDLLLDENVKAIADLEKNLCEHRYMGQKIVKEKEHKAAELSRLKAADSNVEEACGDDVKQFSSVLAELQWKHLT